MATTSGERSNGMSRDARRGTCRLARARDARECNRYSHAWYRASIGIDRIADVTSHCYPALLPAVRPTRHGAAAQTTATISGHRQDASGGVLPGVTVTATKRRTGLVRTAVTGPRAASSSPALPPGVYELRAELAGLQAARPPRARAAVAETLALNIMLQVGDLAIVDVVVGDDARWSTPSTSELSYLVGSEHDRAAAAERPQLHRSRAAAARRARLSRIATAARSSRTASA